MKLSKLAVLGATAALVFAACNNAGPGGSTGTGGSAAAGGQPDVCKNKKGSSTSEIHIYSSLPLEGTSLAQSTSIVNELKAVLDGTKVGNFTIKYTSLDDASPAKN